VLRLIRKLWLVLFVLVAIALALSYLDRVAGRLKPPPVFDANYVILALFLQFAFWATLALSWRRVVRVCSNIQISAALAFLQSMLVSLGKYVPGKVWGLMARAAHLGHYDVKPMDIVAATVHEQIIQLHSGMILAAFLAAVVYGQFYWWLLAAFALASAFMGNRIVALGLKCLRIIFAKLGRNLTVASEGAADTQGYVTLLLYYGLLWLISGFILVCLYLSFTTAVLDQNNLAALLLANTAGIIFGFVAIFAPGGIGVREVTAVAILTTVMNLSNAVLLTVLSRVWFIATDLIGGGAALFIDSRIESSSRATARSQGVPFKHE
jgi:glycosyltransferase 2 family protein